MEHRDVPVGGDLVHRQVGGIGQDLVGALEVLEEGHGDQLAPFHPEDVQALDVLHHARLPKGGKLGRALDDIGVEDFRDDDVGNFGRSHG